MKSIKTMPIRFFFLSYNKSAIQYYPVIQPSSTQSGATREIEIINFSIVFMDENKLYGKLSASFEHNGASNRPSWRFVCTWWHMWWSTFTKIYLFQYLVQHHHLQRDVGNTHHGYTIPSRLFTKNPVVLAGFISRAKKSTNMQKSILLYVKLHFCFLLFQRSCHFHEAFGFIFTTYHCVSHKTFGKRRKNMKLLKLNVLFRSPCSFHKEKRNYLISFRRMIQQ